MDFLILQPEIQEFIIQNTAADVSRLALQKNPFPQVSWIEILNQISCRSKAKDKLPTWFAAPDIIYPAKISIEQTSSEKTAKYKSGIVSGEKLIDLTGGFGIDDYFFAQKLQKVVHCEINPELSAIACHNFRSLSATNIDCIAGDSTETLQQSKTSFDWIYVDPSRRSQAKGKVFMLKDCLPNVPELLDAYFSHAPNILLKTAPILDISAGLSELKNVKSIHIVAIDNEVKELLWELSRDYGGQTEIRTVNILPSKTEKFNFILGKTASAIMGSPEKYLYEPNAPIMKSGGFEEIGTRFGLKKLHQHSHLYTSGDLIAFPGRRFEILEVFPYEKTGMKSLEGKKMNISVRNFPENVENLRKKWKIKDGGNVYCFFSTDANNRKIVLLCNKIQT